MNWSAKEAIGNISNIITTAALSSLSTVSPFAAALAGSAAEGIIKGIDTFKQPTPLQSFQEIIRCATQKALDEVNLELPVSCKTELINTVFSTDNALCYRNAADSELLFEKTITDIIHSYQECDITTVPIKQITHCILDHIESEILKNREALVLQNNMISRQILQIVQKSNDMFVECKSFSFDSSKIRERSLLLLRQYQHATRFSYYEQHISPAIVPNLETSFTFLTIWELIPWIESQGINHIQIAGEGGTGKTSLLVSLWEYLATSNSYADYLVNMVTLNHINDKTKDEAEYFLLQEYAGNFLFDDIWLTMEQLNEALKLLSMADRSAAKCKYVLLLDGFNEVRSDYQTSLIRQLTALSRYQNVIIILTSRFELHPQHLLYDFFPLYVAALDEYAIFAYLEKHVNAAFHENTLFQLGNPISDEDYTLLRNPMMLTVYCETDQLAQANVNSRLFSFPLEIKTKHDLIRAFFEGLACKEYNLNGNFDNLVLTLFINNFVLPYIAAQMNHFYICSYKDVKKYLEAICCQAQQNNPVFNALFHERDLELQWEHLRKRPDLYHILRKHLLENPTVFIGNDSRDGENAWSFIHQEFRDYCLIKFNTTYLEYLLLEESPDIVLSENQLHTVILKIRKKLQSYPNLYWLDKLESIPEEINAYHKIDCTNIYTIMKIVLHSGLRQIEEMNNTAKKALPDASQTQISNYVQTGFSALIDSMDLQYILIGTSNFKENYLAASFRLSQTFTHTNKTKQYHDLMLDAVCNLANQLKEGRFYADFDIQLPTDRQLAVTASDNNHSPIYKIIISCLGQYGMQYGILGIVYNSYPALKEGFKDYTCIPKPNGYRALHASVILNKELTVEVIIRQTRKLRSDKRFR